MREFGVFRNLVWCVVSVLFRFAGLFVVTDDCAWNLRMWWCVWFLFWLCNVVLCVFVPCDGGWDRVTLGGTSWVVVVVEVVGEGGYW